MVLLYTSVYIFAVYVEPLLDATRFVGMMTVR
jgi:hypothetical protein